MISKINFTGNNSQALNKSQKSNKNESSGPNIFGKKATTVGLRDYVDSSPYFSVIA